MFGSVHGRVLGVSAAALIAGTLSCARAAAQQLSLLDMGKFCAFAARQDEAGLKELERLLARDLDRIRAGDDTNAGIRTRSELRAVRRRIATARREAGVIEAKIAQAHPPAGTSSLDAGIREQERLIAEVRTRRLAIHAGTDGKAGIDELRRLIAEIDRKTAANDFPTGAERTAAPIDRARHAAALQVRLAEKADLAAEYAAKRDELDRLKRERDSRDPQPDKLKALQADLAAADRKLEGLREEEKDLRGKEDRYREQAARLLSGEAEIRGCIADRRRILAAAQPPAPPRTEQPRTPVASPPPASAAIATFGLLGTWKGECNGKFAVSGEFTINAAAGRINGTYTGGDSGAIGGQIDGAGQLSASGGGGRSVRWTGSVTQIGNGNRWAGTGRWSSSGESIACEGTWQSP